MKTLLSLFLLLLAGPANAIKIGGSGVESDGGTMTGPLTLSGPTATIASGSSITASAFFGDGSGIFNFAVIASSRVAESLDVNTTSFVKISTVSMTLRGGRPILIFIVFINEQGTTGDIIYDARLTLNGGQIGDTIITTLAKEGGGTNAHHIINFHFFASALPAGASEFVLEIKSDSTGMPQLVRDRRLTILEL